MNKICYITVLFFISVFGIRGQDMHFTQFYSAPLYLNPAFAGADVCSRVSLVYRNQWPGINTAYKSYLLSIDHLFSFHNIGGGLLVGKDYAGTGNLTTTIINPIVAYQFKLDRKVMLRCALQPGVTIRSIDFSKLLFGDQIYTGMPTREAPTVSRSFLDIGAGAICFTQDYWGGISVYHINKPDETLMGFEGAPLPIRYTVHGGYKYRLNEDEKDEMQMKSLTGVLHYRGQKKFDQLDVGIYYTHGAANIGMWYRGIPWKHYKPGYPNRDALALIIGIKNKRATFGYSYDVTISQLASFSQGAHEVTMSYQLCKPGKKKKKKMQVPCPKF